MAKTEAVDISDLVIPYYKRGTAITKELIDIFVILKERGFSYTQISKIVGPSANAVSERLRYYNDPDKWRERLNKKDVGPWEKKIRRFCGRGEGESLPFTEQEFRENVEECDYLTGEKVYFDDLDTFEMDHIKAAANGGSGNLDNCGALKKETNRAKGSLSKEEFIELCYKVVRHDLKKKRFKSVIAKII